LHIYRDRARGINNNRGLRSKMILCIITGFLGFVCGIIGMAILASSSQAGLIEKENTMRQTLMKVLHWHHTEQQNDFPENDIRQALTLD